ncbi:MAG: leucine-rich repeat domain-containing protein [Spirochaetaceae bacterium]|jgi:hypothetical protein|nr:leucine-rich repeat domain-containing protein [Spirochaetaceae bacterium]
MKKAFLRALCLTAALMAAAAASLNAQTEKTPEGLVYERNGQGITITGYTGKAAALVIPAKIEGLPVTSIGDGAFYNCTGLTSVIIPGSVTSIGDRAFAWCGGLTSVTIPTGVISIGDRAFSGCERLASVTILKGVTFIGDSAFWECGSLTSVTILKGVTFIGDSAFYECGSLTSVTFEAGSRIGSGNFGDDGEYPPFPGDLRAQYLAQTGGAGTYTRPYGGDNWTKQP